MNLPCTDCLVKAICNPPVFTNNCKEYQEYKEFQKAQLQLMIQFAEKLKTFHLKDKW